MFTGIISSKGRVTKRTGLRLEIEAALPRARVGDSVAVNGVCLTIVKSLGTAKSRRLAFDLSQETLDRTTLGFWSPGRCVNVEPALRAGAVSYTHLGIRARNSKQPDSRGSGG